MLSPIKKIELEEALKAIRLLIEYDAASRVSFEWKLGEHPKVVYTATAPLEYISVSFTVQDKEENG
jgi:hypothetical protein